ncbi:hypothetical protein N9H39_01955 [Gammaproteobacteria bacterium]|nr:hypothetical protein [Gammaproteobacteria bacterium]
MVKQMVIVRTGTTPVELSDNELAVTIEKAAVVPNQIEFVGDRIPVQQDKCYEKQ